MLFNIKTLRDDDPGILKVQEKPVNRKPNLDRSSYDSLNTKYGILTDKFEQVTMDSETTMTKFTIAKEELQASLKKNSSFKVRAETEIKNLEYELQALKEKSLAVKTKFCEEQKAMRSQLEEEKWELQDEKDKLKKQYNECHLEVSKRNLIIP